MSIPGYATQAGTERFKNRFKDQYDEGHFTLKNDLYFSSIGIGSYLGDMDDATDALYCEALKQSIAAGVNVIDSAINYRAQRSERAFGKALKELIDAGEIQRDEMILCTKGGFIAFDGNVPANMEQYLQETFIEPEILELEDVAQGCHAMTPKYLEDQLAKSLKNLGVETIDIYYLHNPETQLAEVDRGEFMNRMRAAFSFLEEKVKEGKIKMYGTATWTGFRVARDAQDFLSIEELSVLAREAGGPEHHFKAVQLPFNLAMPEAWIFPNQPFAAHSVPFLGLVDRLKLIAINSASLLQAKLTGPLPDYLDPHFTNLQKSSQRAIQFARSCPGITTSLVGMKQKEHVIENMETAKVPQLTEAQLFAMFQKSDEG